jgi:predicted TIM-barrel fold metal-dependent hydrolase
MSDPRAAIFDAHLHIIDPAFPLIANEGFFPEPFTCADYAARTADLGIAGGAVVSGSFQGFDQSYLRAALKVLGPSFVGVAQLPVSVSETEIASLDSAGVRAVRFNLKRGGSEGLEHLETLARKVHDTAGWHVELYVESRHLSELYERLRGLPALSIDHLGLTDDGFDVLLRLVEVGAKVKATGFGRVELDPAHAMRAIVAANPEALMFGTDLPSTRAVRPFRDEDVALVRDTLPEDVVRKVLWDNATHFYRPRALPRL